MSFDVQPGRPGEVFGSDRSVGDKVLAGEKAAAEFQAVLMKHFEEIKGIFEGVVAHIFKGRQSMIDKFKGIADAGYKATEARIDKWAG